MRTVRVITMPLSKPTVSCAVSGAGPVGAGGAPANAASSIPIAATRRIETEPACLVGGTVMGARGSRVSENDRGKLSEAFVTAQAVG